MHIMDWASPVVALPLATVAISFVLIRIISRKIYSSFLYKDVRLKPVQLRRPEERGPTTKTLPTITTEYDAATTASMQLHKELYYKLQHLEDYPEILPTARDTLISLLSETLENASKTPDEGILSIQEYSREVLIQFQRKEDEKVMELFEQYLGRRKAKEPREMFITKEEAHWWLAQSSPVKYVDGSWLGHINKVTTPFGLRRITKNAWQVLSEELGDGDLEKNHVHLYHQLMKTVEPGLPSGDDPDYIHPRHQLNEPGVWKAAVAQLLISLFPHQFLPEIMGFNLHYEAIALETLKVSRELKELGIDPYYFILHISIDNADSGHTAMALESAMEYIELVRQREGDVVAHQTWKRVQAGYILSKGLPTAPVHPNFRKPSPVSLQRKGKFPRNELEAEVIRIFKAKAAVSQKIHCNSRTRFGEHTITEWLEPTMLESEVNQMEFLDALSNTKPWIYKGDSSRSRFMKELSWKGRMFGSFTQSEVYTIQQWIDSLGRGEGNIDTKFYWKFINNPEITSYKAFRNYDICVNHPVFISIPEKGLERLLPSASCLPRTLGIDPSAVFNLEKLIPLWFTHPCLLEQFVCVPAKTTTSMGCCIIRVLRAQYGFDPEDFTVAGMDEVRRPESTGLVDLGLEIVQRSGFTQPRSLKQVLDTWKSEFGLLMLHLSKRPIRNAGLLLGLTMAFIDLHDAISLSSTLISAESRRALREMAKRERDNLDICLRDLQATPSLFVDFCRGYHLGRTEIDKCWEGKIKT